MNSQKKIFLKSYLIQESKISRLKKMKTMNPKNKENYDQKIKESKLLRKKIEKIIDSVDDDLLRELLYNKYILGKTLEEIGLILNYSKRHIERLHIKALEKIEI